MTRIVAGRAGGLRLAVPPGTGTRPTSERVREALFSALVARDALAGARVLDLYAGSGALGLEALSRGAASAVLVERAPVALRALRANVAATAAALAPARAQVLAGDAAAGPPAGGPFSLVFLDPPYALAASVLGGVLGGLAVGLAAGATVVVERATRDEVPPWPAGWEPAPARRYGETTLWYLRAP